MNLTLMNEKYKNCNCGKKHECPIDYVEIGNGAIKKLSTLCGEYSNILLISDENTYRVCGGDVYENLKYKISKNIVLSPNGDVVIPNEEKIEEIEKELTNETDLIIGVGSGVINDLCKHVSYKHNLSYFIVATAPSMDGYASVGAALILEGMKITLNARPPKAIIADTSVLKNAPLDMLKAGYGDIVGKYSCLNDWKLSALVNDEYFCDAIYELTYSQAEKVKVLAKDILKRDENAVGALMEALVLVGIAMSYVGNSRPASGSEHHLSHFFEITGIIDNKEYYAHGIDVLYSSYVTSLVRQKIINSTPKYCEFDKKKWESEIKRIYKTSADGVIALQNKLGWYDINDIDVIVKKQELIKNVLSEAPTPDETKKMIDEIELSVKEFYEFYTEEKTEDAVKYAKDLKDRYSVLWLNYIYFNEEK